MPHDVETPSAWVVRWAPLITARGPVLDLACGSGRHARYLAALGHEVVAVDRDADALAGLAGHPGVRTLQADLEDGRPWPFAVAEFAGIVVTNYLWRPLFPGMLASLAPDGVLIYDTFAAGNERYGRPSNPEFLLRPGELLQAFGAGLSVVAFEQGRVARPRPAVIQRLCAVKRAWPEVVLDP